MKKNLFLLLLLFFLGVSCKQDDYPTNNPLDNIQQIWPLKIGNYWVFHITNFDSLGNTVSIVKDSMLVVEKVQLLCNLTGYKMIEYRNDKYYGFTKAYNNLEGFWLEGGGVCLMYSYPNDTGKSIDNCYPEQFVISKNATITVSVGIFTCYHYSVESFYYGYFKQNAWLCPNIGLIKKEQYAKTKGGNAYLTFKQELISYHVLK